MSKLRLMTLASALAVAGSMMAPGSLMAEQDSSARMMALTSSADATIARRLLMDSIGANNDVLHEMLDGYLEWDQDEFRARLVSMSAMMTAFPNLFRADPNPWTEEGEAADPAQVSLSLPTIWENWDEFAARSQEASDTMFEASLVPRSEALAVVEDLEGQCESCHAQFRRAEQMRSLEEYLAPAPGSAP